MDFRQHVLGADWETVQCHPISNRRPSNLVNITGSISPNRNVDIFVQGLLLFGPSAILLLFAPLKIYQLYGAKLKVLPNYRGFVKFIVATALEALQLTSLVFEIIAKADPIYLSAGILSFVASSFVIVLSFLEHGRSIEPSTLLNVYLLLSLFAELVQIGLLYTAYHACNVSTISLVTFVIRFVLLVLEAQPKRSILREPYNEWSSEETAGVLGRAFFTWVTPLFFTGANKILEIQDLPKNPSMLASSKLRCKIQEKWDQRGKPEGRFTLLIALARTTFWENMAIFLPRMILTIFRYCQPLLISWTISYVTRPRLAADANEAFRLIVSVFIVYVGIAVFNGMADIYTIRLEVASRGAVVGLIHGRSLTIKDGASDDTAAVTLMSNDVDQVSYWGPIFHELWAAVLELIIGMILLARELGWVCIVPLMIVGFTSQGTKFVTANITGRQKAWSMATQQRISITKAILDSMKNIKMMGIVKVMENKIQDARDHDIAMGTAFRWIMVAFNASANFLGIFSPVVTLVVFAVQARLRGSASLDTNTAFTSIAMIGMVSGPANMILVLIPNIASIGAAFSRIDKYLVSPSREDQRVDIEKSNPHDAFEASENGTQANGDAHHDSGDSKTELAISVEGATIRPASTADPVLKDISFSVKKRWLAVCSGAVGTGKSTLAKAILGDLPPDSGTIATSSRLIAYCAQTAWMINGTVRSIICGPNNDPANIDEEWYKKVLHACDLEEDIENMPNGEYTVIGSRGITLSGGQKQRVALARAVFARRDIVILDDVLSALDANTERHIVENLIGPKGLFRQLGTTVFLITHATQHFPISDYIIVIDTEGRIAEQGTWDHLRSQTGHISKVVLKESDDSNRSQEGTSEKALTPKGPADDTNLDLQDLSRKTGDIALYAYYFGSIGKANFALLVLSMASYSFFLSFPQYWLKWWTESNGQHMGYYIGVFFLLSVACFISANGSLINIMIFIGPRSGKILHNRLLHTVMKAPQSYFSTTDTGTTLNRFSQDMQMIDRRLPIALIMIGYQVFKMLASFILLFTVQKYVSVTLPFILIVLWAVQKVYLQTSRQLRFLDLESKSLVNSSFLETLEGIATIRAFGWQQAFAEDNIKKLDVSQGPNFMMSVIQRWLNLVLDLMIAGLAVMVISFAVAFKGKTTGGQIGIALNVVLGSSSILLRLIEAWTTLETSLGAIARLKNFERDVLPEDKEGEDQTPPTTWPAHGALGFKEMEAAYNPSTLALKGVTMSISPGCKVGVCGRTGSGKSSLLLSLLRIIEIESGSITLDGLDLTTLPRDTVRSRIITVPQDPMLVQTDTVRQNLDLTGTIPDEKVIEALEKVKLWSIIQSRATSAEATAAANGAMDAAMGAAAKPTTDGDEPEIPKVGLDAQMKSYPLSQGQQQLFSLARALLMRESRGKVVILDEATSNVDGETDKLMQNIVREEFKDHTIITVAHRLDTIMDADQVAVLDAGRVVEFGPPKELVEREGSKFGGLYGGKK